MISKKHLLDIVLDQRSDIDWLATKVKALEKKLSKQTAVADTEAKPKHRGRPRKQQ